MNIKILPSAMDDLRRGYLFYESQEVGLGDYYRCFSKRFPYAIYYRMEEVNSVLVYRILDMRQNPAKTAKSLKD
jgi:hypothetical protein